MGGQGQYNMGGAPGGPQQAQPGQQQQAGGYPNQQQQVHPFKF